MDIYYSDHFTLPLPPTHRFPMPKYALLRERVLSAHFPPTTQLLVAPPALDEEILRVHTPAYWSRVVTGTLDEKEIRRIGFPWSPGLVERTRRSVGGTLAACRAVMPERHSSPPAHLTPSAPMISVNLAGGTHHAYPEHGEGYCVLNDVAIAARAMLAEARAARVVIIDCDVHQGNGTAAIFIGDPLVYTFSIHADKNFPAHKESSHLDIALPDGCGDSGYLSALLEGLEIAIEDSQADLALYIAGADPYAGDRLGRLSLSKNGLLERDRLVFDACRSSGIPVVVVMGGGYGLQIEDTVDIQFQTVCLAVEMAA
jgi:acetoin utilization deacetylase AcuC-like enzyme